MGCLFCGIMKIQEIKISDHLKSVLDLFEGGAKLVGVSYIACNESSDSNDIRKATLSFLGKQRFNLVFEQVECIHVAPIRSGSIYVESIALGQFRNLFFFADDDYFNITSPDTSLTYCIGGRLYIEK